MKKIKSLGFTLIELLVVIGILAILLAITLIAINPARQFQQSNNAKRSSDVNAILNSINQYMADNKGSLPPGVWSDTAQTIQSTAWNSFCTTLLTLYIAALPTDPLTNNGTPVTATDCAGTGAWNTGYTIATTTNNRLTVAAPAAELSATINVTR